MRADGEELDLLPPVGGMAVDVMEVEMPTARRTFVLVFIQAATVLATLHGMHVLHELYLGSFDEEFQWEVESWRLHLVLYYVVVVGLALFCLDGGHADEPAREAGPDLGANGSESEDEGAQAGAVQGPETLRSQVSGQRRRAVDLQEFFKGAREVQMVLDLHRAVGGDVDGLQCPVPLGSDHRPPFLLGGRKRFGFHG
ncbi:DNA-binding protein [Human mastadenovirus E]|uniref:DNA-binding protein n=2 Tax=Human mastadenovirus E TaxID=130308 RepID=Q5GFB7_ADE04|nr:DNA binding protein [Human adenovirus E4]AAT97440.1 DNA-binding protein [Human adenovirus E4]AAT97488.1 DNA-binding protein [Human adenovirus E4]AVQ69363.1 DNA-binding protein [Human mastadenovirus E]QOX73561.1 DNA-binding protein [Human adenovirus E4]